ncbi:MAG: hypothetical protein V3V18_15600 [Methylococcales bacterium]
MSTEQTMPISSLGSQHKSESKRMNAEQTLQISIPESKSQLIKVVRVFIRKRYRLVENDQANVTIVDCDAYEARSMLDDLRQQYPDRTIIGLSVSDQQDDSVIHVQKPFSQDDLIQALDKASETVNPSKIVVGEKMGGSIHQAASAVSDKQADNDRQVARNGISTRTNAAQYNPADYLQEALKTAYNKSRKAGFNLRLDVWWQPIIIFPSMGKVWVDADDQKLQAFCRLPLKTFARHHSQEAQRSTEIKISPEPMFNTNKLSGSLQAMDAFLWKVAWWNAGGQLPLGITERQLIKLKSWPNITRFLCPDHAVQICALLFHAPVSPLRIAEILDIESKEVYGLISAANALGLIETIQNQSITPVKPSASSVSSTANRPNTGLLRRILSRFNRK